MANQIAGPFDVPHDDLREITRAVNGVAEITRAVNQDREIRLLVNDPVTQVMRDINRLRF